MKTDKQILEAVHDRYDKSISGLCAASYILYKEDGVFTKQEYLRFRKIWDEYALTKDKFYHYYLTEVHITKNKVNTYGWKPHTEPKRFEWLNNKIKSLE